MYCNNLLFFILRLSTVTEDKNVVFLFSSLSNRTECGKVKCYFIKEITNMKLGRVVVSLRMYLTLGEHVFEDLITS